MKILLNISISYLETYISYKKFIGYNCYKQNKAFYMKIIERYFADKIGTN